MKIAMTGVSGNMGSEALKQTFELPNVEFIRIILRNTNKNQKLAKRLKKLYKNKIDIIFSSIDNQEACEQLVTNVDYVLHMAAVIPPLSDNSPQRSYDCNRCGTVALVNAIKKQNPMVKYIHISTIAVYGNRNEKHPFGRVGDPLLISPFDAYAKDKLYAERYVLEAQLENQQRVHKIRHDLKAHAITLSGLLVSGKVDEAQSYMWNMIYDMDTSQQSFCSNPYLNSVFSHFSNKFKKLEMELQLDVQIGEEELPYMELCQILSNALENAWDASKELAADRRKASVQMRYNRDYLIIRIKNHCKNNIYVKKGEIPKSTKGGAEHGFGVRTIQDAARKLEGEMLCYTEDNNFVLDVMLKVL